MKILLICYDNGQMLHYFPIGTAYLAGTLKAAGHEVHIYNQTVSHASEDHLTRYLDKVCFDVVGLGFVGNYYTYKKAIKISEAINASKQRPHYIIGGHGPSAEPQYFISVTGADAVVVGEGERAVFQALEGYGVFRADLIEDLDSIPRPAYNLFPVQYYRLRREPNARPTDFVMPIISARGCLYKCNFCYRMDEGYRMRSIDSVVDEIKYLQREYGITYIDFADELTMPSCQRTAELCEALMPLNIRWMCNGRLNIAAKYPDLLPLMKRAGCVFINYGIEAMDDEVLKTIGKKLNVEQITKGIETTLAAGISPGFNIIFGHIGDTKETLQRGLEFILKYDDGAQRRTMLPVTPYPGSALYHEAIRRGLLKGPADFYQKHKNADLPTVNFTNLTDDEFIEALYDANTALLKNHYQNELNKALESAKSLYLNRDTSFRGFR